MTSPPAVTFCAADGAEVTGDHVCPAPLPTRPNALPLAWAGARINGRMRRYDDHDARIDGEREGD